MGMRLRLKSTFDISTFPADDQVILTALKKYGMILADNGSAGIDIYLDGSQFLDDLEALHPSELAGVEYYPIESAPGEYRKLTDNCGVLLLWSKK